MYFSTIILQAMYTMLIDLAVTLVDRMKTLFVAKGLLSFNNKETVTELNGVKLEAYIHSLIPIPGHDSDWMHLF